MSRPLIYLIIFSTRFVILKTIIKFYLNIEKKDLNKRSQKFIIYISYVGGILMDAPQGNGLYAMTPEALRSMPWSDVKYFSGRQHGGITESPDSLDDRMTNEGFSVITERSLLPHPQIRLVVGTAVHADGRTKYMIHRSHGDANQDHYNLPGIATRQKATIAEHDIAVKLLVAGYVVDTEVVQRKDASYEVRVFAQTPTGRSQTEFDRAVSAILSEIGVEKRKRH